MRLVIALLVIVFSACSNSNNTDQKETDKKIEVPNLTTTPKPAIVPVTEEQMVKEFDRLESDRKTNDPQQGQVEDMLRRAHQRYGNKPMILVFAGTDSVSGGLDEWRTCANFGLKQLGLPPDSIVIFNDQNGVSCENNPNGYVSQIAIIGPEGIEQNIRTPVYKTEKMTVIIGGVVSINSK